MISIKRMTGVSVWEVGWHTASCELNCWQLPAPGQVTPGPVPPLLFIMIKVVTKSGARERELGREPRAILPCLPWVADWLAISRTLWHFFQKVMFSCFFSGQPFISHARKLPLFAGVIFLPKNHHWRELVLVAPPNTWHQRETQKNEKVSSTRILQIIAMNQLRSDAW